MKQIKRNQKTSSGENKKPTIIYSNKNIRFWSDTSLMTIEARKNVDYDRIETVLKITNLDENAKVLKNEEGKPDNGYFVLTQNELSILRYCLHQMDDDKIYGFPLIHINKETGAGSQAQFIREENGINLYITYFDENQETIDEWNFNLFDSSNKNMAFEVYVIDKTGELVSEERTIENTFMNFLNSIDSIYALVSGIGESIAELCGGRSYQQNAAAKSAIASKSLDRVKISRKGLADMANDDEEEEINESGDDEEEEKPIIKKKSSLTGDKSKKKKINLKEAKELLGDDD